MKRSCNMNWLNSKTIKMIFGGIILFVLIGLIFTNITGKKQDQHFKGDFQVYEEAIRIIESEDTDSGIQTLEGLVLKYPNEYVLWYQLGLAYSANSEYQKASLNYQKALNIRPSLLQDTQFTFKMGEALYHIGELEISKTYLTMPAPEELKEQQTLLLQEIDKQSKS